VQYCQFILSVVVAGDKYCTFGHVQGKVEIICYMWKIFRSEQRNFANIRAELGKICCGMLWF